MTALKSVLVKYPFPRDYADLNRLNLQHYIWKDIFGYNLHPKIPHDRTHLKVADVGTGTGIWLLEMASRLGPTAQLCGFDVDISQAGPREWLPENVSIRKLDIFGEVPDDLVSQFDIVHLRLFAFVIRDDPGPVIRNLMRLLKPGGYLQWGEIDVQSMRIDTSSPDLPTESLVALWEATIPKDSLVWPTWIRNLPRTLEGEGLLGVEADWQVGQHHSVMAIHWCNLTIHEMFGHKLDKVNPDEASRILNLAQKASAESRRGAMYSFDRVCIVGQKSHQLYPG